MREIRLSGSEGGGLEFNRFSLPLSLFAVVTNAFRRAPAMSFALAPFRAGSSRRLCIRSIQPSAVKVGFFMLFPWADLTLG